MKHCSGAGKPLNGESEHGVIFILMLFVNMNNGNTEKLLLWDKELVRKMTPHNIVGK